MNYLSTLLFKYSAYVTVVLLSSIGLAFFLSVMKKDNFKKNSKQIVTYFLINQFIAVALHLIVRRILSVFNIYLGEDTDVILFIFLNFLYIYIGTVIFYKLNDRAGY